MGKNGALQAVIVWDTGTYDNRTEDSAGQVISVADAIERGHVSFELHGKKLRGGYSLTRIRRGRDPGWILVKKADRFAQRGSDPERDEPESVKSGRDIEQVADEK
jgi:phage gp29-like protein